MNRIVAVVAALSGLWFLLLSIPRSFAWHLNVMLPKMLWGQLIARRSLEEALVAFAFAAILLTFAYRRFRSSAKKTAEYTKEEEGDWLRLTVTPAAAPVLWFPVILAVGLGAGTSSAGAPYLWVLGLIFAFLTWLLLLRDHRGGNPTASRSFRVNSDGIETQGTFLRKADIHHLNIKNKFSGEIEIVYDAQRGVPTGTAMGLASRRALAEVAYRVEVEAGGKAHLLAAGLDDVTARGLAAEIGKALKLSAPTS